MSFRINLMLAFGIVTVYHTPPYRKIYKEGMINYRVDKEHYQFNLETLDWALDKYADCRVEGDRDKVYDFLTNPDRSDEPRIYIGSVAKYPYGDNKEYFITRV